MYCRQQIVLRSRENSYKSGFILRVRALNYPGQWFLILFQINPYSCRTIGQGLACWPCLWKVADFLFGPHVHANPETGFWLKFQMAVICGYGFDLSLAPGCENY